MAGDWIKVEHTLPDKPEVIAMASILGIDQDAVSGKLIRVFVWADLNCIDGNDLNVTDAFLDRVTCCQGFADAMRKVGWLHGESGALSFRNFERHNGETAKARSETNRRVAKHRARQRECNGETVTDVTEKTLQKPLPEKRREENPFPLFASAVPSLEKKGAEPKAIRVSDHPQLHRAAKLFRYGPDRTLDKAETRAWKDAKKVVEGLAESDWDALERRYASTDPEDVKYRRQSLSALLNNLNESVTKAKSRQRHKPACSV